MKKRWVSASAIGSAAFCPKYLELRESNAPLSKAATKARREGTEAHEKLNQNVLEDTRCFIAGYAYGVNDARTQALRAFRDRVLHRSKLGRAFVAIYYHCSPWIVRGCKRWKLLDIAVRRVLDVLVAWLGADKQ